MKKILTSLLSLCLILLVISCSDHEPVAVDQRNSPSKVIVETPRAFPGRSGIRDSVDFGDHWMRFKRFGESIVFQGDIMISPSFLGSTDGRVSAAPTQYVTSLWTNKTVPYVIESLADETRILQAIAHIEANSNLRFVRRVSEPNYLAFFDGDGCWSYVGMQGGRQPVSIGSCSFGSIVHEICHAVGVWHEQSRPDRNNHIVINYQNIDPDESYNFDIIPSAMNYGPFDFNSIMLYDSWAFSITGGPTITRLDGSTFFANRSGLSVIDASCLTEFYAPGVRSLDCFDVSANAAGTMYYAKKVASTAYQVYTESGTLLSGASLSQIAVNAAGTVYGINGTSLQYYSAGAWRGMGRPSGTLKDIAITGNGTIYVISQVNRIYNLHRYSAGAWSLVSNTPATPEQLAGADGDRLYVLTGGTSGSRVRRYENGVWTSLTNPQQYNYVGLSITNISAAGNVLYGYATSRNNKHVMRFSPTLNDWIEQRVNNLFLSNGAIGCDGTGKIYVGQ